MTIYVMTKNDNVLLSSSFYVEDLTNSLQSTNRLNAYISSYLMDCLRQVVDEGHVI